MKFTLKDYQEEAVKEVLENLRDARDFWSARKRKTAFSLTATTGAGKTVMAAAGSRRCSTATTTTTSSLTRVPW